MTDPKVVHPNTQNRIDFRNHILWGLHPKSRQKTAATRLRIHPKGSYENVTVFSGPLGWVFRTPR
jgi:hypothetical protein